MSKRVLVVVDRSMTDKTPKIIWEHEIKLLEEIHGCEITPVDVTKLDKMPMDHFGIGETFKCASIQQEYDRLAVVYGMHEKVEMSVVEKVYGTPDEGRFARAVGGDACIAIDEWDLKDTAAMLVESVEMTLWEPKIKKEQWTYEDLQKAFKARGMIKGKQTLREAIIALMREKLSEETKEAA